MKQLILGGARSGKSRIAESRAIDAANQLKYIATGEARDDEMAHRIQIHQQNRGENWQTYEEPIYLSRALKNADQEGAAIVVDCLTLWLSNCLEKSCFDREKTLLLDTLPQLKASVFLVSNEVGAGVIPLGKLSRTFVDYSGWLHQDLAKLCDTVTLVVAGLTLEMK